jgi:NAD-dependent dihydropyrimidine dehydrogenase PreA subunit
MDDTIYDQMTERIMLKGSQIIPQLFKMVVDLEEAELMMAMPGTPEQLSEKVNKTPVEAEQMCQHLYHKGTAFKSFKGGTIAYKMCRDMVQFHDATILWPEAPRAFLDLWQRFIEEEWPAFAKLYTQIIPKPFTRVIAVESAIDTGKQQILDADSANRIIESAEKLAVTKCTCRLIAHKCDQPLDVCIQVNNSARYAIDRGTGKEIGKADALKILRECEDSGLVHVSMNKLSAGHFICNCCGCCCQTFPLLIAEGLEICDPSRFTADIDADLCTGCETCHDRCYFHALEEVVISPSQTVSRVITEKCMGCGLCQVTCPSGAINLKEVRSLDFIPA